MSRVNTSAGKQTFRIGLAIVRNPRIHFRGETKNLGRNVVDKNCSIEADCIHVRQKFLRIAAELLDFRKFRALLLHKRQRLGLEHLERLDVDVTIGDQHGYGFSTTFPNIWLLSRYRCASDASLSGNALSTIGLNRFANT